MAGDSRVLGGCPDLSVATGNPPPDWRLTKVQYPARPHSAIVRPMTKPGRLIAVLDDEPQFCKALSRLLKVHDFEVVTYSCGEDLLTSSASPPADCLLLDLHMPGLSGFDVLERLAAQHETMPAIIITGHDQPGNAERVRALGGADYLLKPLNETQLLAAIERSMKSAAQRQAGEPHSSRT